MRKAWVPLITVVLCLTSLRDSAWAQMRDGWEFQWQQMRMDVKGFDEHVGDVIHRRIVQTFNPPTIVDTFTRDPITLNMGGKNAFRADIRYRKQGWGGGVSGWFLSTSIGNKMSGVLAGLWDGYENKANFFLVNLVLALITSAIILMMIKWLNSIMKEHGV